MFGARPSFGSNTGNTSFGTSFGTSTSSGFGNTSTFGRPSFGTPAQTTAAASSPFGSNTVTGTGGSSLFGQNQNSGGLFGSTANTGFGATSTGFGTSGGGLFGSTSTQPNTTGLFGSSTSTGFNTNQNQNRSFSFGTPTTSASNTGTLFGSTNTGSSLFGSSVTATQQQQQTGTTVKYNPVTGTDTMTRSGVSQNIQTKIEVITAMKEYETKSLEELRLEDYLSGRKGPGQGTTGFGFGQNKFMGQQTENKGWMTNNPTTGGLFGQKPAENKSLFGTNTSTAFGAAPTAGGLFGQTTTTPFGQSTPTSSAGFSFGQTNQAKPAGFSFGQTTSSAPSSIFGQPAPVSQSGTTFGSTGFSFGAPTSQASGGLFGNTQNKPAFGAASTGSTLFGNKPAGSSFGSFGTASSASPFGTTNTNTGTGLFGNQNKTGFSLGATNTGFGGATTNFGSGGGLFGNTGTASKPGTLSFGTTGFGTAAPAGGFGFNQPASGGLFGNTGTTGGLFSSNTTMNAGGSTFGSALGNTGFGANPLQPNSNLANINVVNNNNISNLIKALTNNPFGTSSLLKTASAPTGKADELLNASTTNSSSNDATKISKKPTYVLPRGIGGSPKPRPLGKAVANGLSDFDASKSMLFAGLDDSKNESFSEDPFKPKSFPSVKKLNLKVFKNVKGNQNQSITNGSVVTENSAVPSPLTTPISSRETPNRNSLSPSHGTSPTPDIIKGRNNMKKLNILSKNHLNDTYADLGMPSKPPELTDKDASISLYEAASLEDIPQEHLSTSPHPAGIKLSRSGYYTIPSMENLGEMLDSDGQCLVENFTVGRYGYGNICFQGITNVTNLDLDSIVFIVRKEVEVYPEAVEKPQVGEGLNKLAFVTLDCVWPVDKTMHDIIKSEERLEAMGWCEYLERQCVKMEATFIEYRAETGSWVFKVQHFSKYGLQDDNNDQPMTMAPPANNAAVEVSKENIPPPQTVMDQMLSPIAPPAKTLLGTPLTFQSTNHKVSHGPPAMGLSSPPTSSLLHLQQQQMEESEAEPKRIFLDGTTLELDERGMFVGEELNEDDAHLLCPLSPSTERITIASRAPPREIQSLKSQFFFTDFEESEQNEPMKKGEKRDSGQLLNKENKSRFDKSSIFALKDFSKKLLIEPETSFDLHSTAMEDLPPSYIVEPTIRKSTVEPHQPEPEVSKVAEMQVELREPKSDYHLLPSGPHESVDSERQEIQHLTESIPMKSSLSSKGLKCISDSAAFMSRSFRVGWGPEWTLVHAGNSVGNGRVATPIDEMQEEEDRETPSPLLFLGATGPRASTSKTKRIDLTLHKNLQRRIIAKEKLQLNSENAMPDYTLLETCLRNTLECSAPDDVEMSSTGLPFFAPEKGIELLHRLTLTAAELENSDNRKMSTIFDLCSALWGQLEFYCPEIDGKSEYTESKARKEALSQWLEEVSADAVTEETERALSLEDNPESYLDAVFSYLTARRISEACSLAQNKGDHHLALLLAQSCFGADTPRQIMEQQLENWAEAGMDSFISTRRLILYCLLSGKPTHDASHEKINSCAGLDWRRSLALHLWFVCPATATIAEALKLYEIAAGLEKSDQPSYCEQPNPFYLNESSPRIANFDVCFQLLKLYMDPSFSLETLLEPSAITNDPLDVTTGWLLWLVLQSLGFHNLSEARIEALNTSMIALLESCGLWHWAAFVVLCSPNEDRRAGLIEQLLNRHLLVEGEEGKDDPFYREKELFLLQELRLPERWLHSAKALRAKTLGLINEEAFYLLNSGRWNDAHKLIVATIAPQAVVNEDHDHLKSLLEEFDNFEHVIGWDNGAGIYKNYLDVIEQVEDLKKSREPTGGKMERLRPRLLALCTRLNSLECPTVTHRLAVSEMSRMVVSVLRAILADEPEGVRVLAQQISSLPMAHECALEELSLITHQYLTQVTS